jgi:hypothetical protein
MAATAAPLCRSHAGPAAQLTPRTLGRRITGYVSGTLSMRLRTATFTANSPTRRDRRRDALNRPCARRKPSAALETEIRLPVSAPRSIRGAGGDGKRVSDVPEGAV